jgi:hypothetical protein
MLVKVCCVFFKPSAAKGRGVNAAVADDSSANLHLDFGFRLLDRLSRTDRGLLSLRA